MFYEVKNHHALTSYLNFIIIDQIDDDDDDDDVILEYVIFLLYHQNEILK